MDMDDVRRWLPEVEFEDPLEPLGVAGGAVLVLVGLGTLSGMPWQYNHNALVSVVQVLGILGTIAIGVALAWLALQPRRRADAEEE